MNIFGYNVNCYIICFAYDHRHKNVYAKSSIEEDALTTRGVDNYSNSNKTITSSCHITLCVRFIYKRNVCMMLTGSYRKLIELKMRKIFVCLLLGLTIEVVLGVRQ